MSFPVLSIKSAVIFTLVVDTYSEYRGSFSESKCVCCAVFWGSVFR
jgi:hypothetical protein